MKISNGKKKPKKKWNLFENSNQLDCILCTMYNTEEKAKKRARDDEQKFRKVGTDSMSAKAMMIVEFSVVFICFNGSAIVNNNVCSVSFKIDS